MTPQFQRYTQEFEIENVLPILSMLIGVTLFMGLFAPATAASPTDCQAVDLSRSGAVGVAIDGITRWKDTSFPLTAIVQRDRLPAPFLEAAPPLRSSRFNQGIGTGNTCLSQSFRKNTVVNHAMVRSIGKGASKSIIPVMRVPVLPYNEKRQALQARTILPEILITPSKRPPSIIGPIQENEQSDQANIATLNQAMTIRPSSSTESRFAFEGRPILATDTLKISFQLPANEPLRMNMTTTQALHGGNCASGCP
ncbi:MAG: hypothetical protein OJF47_000347 [Nitrospira sp.]|jgi:hypothetical protein|nr:MAG: hypothetical protein OJF47_000347 [Nitrospira sp.]